jgi:cytochrome c551/c552
MLGIDPNNFTSALFIGVGAMLVASLVLGAAIWALFTAGSQFFKHNVPSDAEQAAFEKAFRTASSAPHKPLNPNAEPLILSAIGFVLFLGVGGLFLSQIPGPRQTPKEEAKPAVAALPTSGNLTEIVAALPAGDSSKGQALYSAKGCVGCHSLEKDKRLVGPSFYGLWTHAATRKAGLAPKEYVYESIVKPNEYIVDSYQSGLMPQNYATQFTPEEMANLLAWFEKEHAQQ